VGVLFSSRRRHTRLVSDWSSDVCSSDLQVVAANRTTESFESLRKAAGTAATRLQQEILDATDEVAVRRLVDAIVTRHKRLDVMEVGRGWGRGRGEVWGWGGGVNERRGKQ